MTPEGSGGRGSHWALPYSPIPTHSMVALVFTPEQEQSPGSPEGRKLLKTEVSLCSTLQGYHVSLPQNSSIQHPNSSPLGREKTLTSRSKTDTGLGPGADRGKGDPKAMPPPSESTDRMLRGGFPGGHGTTSTARSGRESQSSLAQ